MKAKNETLYVPLAERMRPQLLEEVVGQEHLLGEKGILREYLQRKYLPSFLLWGPPGSGKTTIARLLAESSGAVFVSRSAVFTGVAELRTLFVEARKIRARNEHYCLFIDEMHRFSKSQQDALLREVEEGTISLIAATTENPSFEVNSALLSRLQVFILKKLSKEALQNVLDRVLASTDIHFEDAAREYLLGYAQGDARRLLNCLEQCLRLNMQGSITVAMLHVVLSNKQANYSKRGDMHYDLISALHKSVRGSDCNAALFWLARMLEGGEDPRYIARRLLRMAYEDIGLSDPQAATVVLNAWQSFERLGSPEGELCLAQAVIYLSLAPKSNRAYTAQSKAGKFARLHSDSVPPMRIVNAPTAKMKEWGHGKGYVYDHDTETLYSGQKYFPDELEEVEFYLPIERGFERELHKRVEYFKKLRKKIREK